MSIRSKETLWQSHILYNKNLFSSMLSHKQNRSPVIRIECWECYKVSKAYLQRRKLLAQAWSFRYFCNYSQLKHFEFRCDSFSRTCCKKCNQKGTEGKTFGSDFYVSRIWSCLSLLQKNWSAEILRRVGIHDS